MFENCKIKTYKPTIVEQIRAILAFPFAFAAIVIGGGYFCALAAKSVIEVVTEDDDAE